MNKSIYQFAPSSQELGWPPSILRRARPTPARAGPRLFPDADDDLRRRPVPFAAAADPDVADRLQVGHRFPEAFFRLRHEGASKIERLRAGDEATDRRIAERVHGRFVFGCFSKF